MRFINWKKAGNKTCLRLLAASFTSEKAYLHFIPAAYLSGMKVTVYVLCFLLPVVSGRAQSYWQQHVATRIHVTLNDHNHTLHGSTEMVYTNHSPDTLRYLYLHLWPNAYQHDHTPFAQQQYRNRETAFYYANPKDRGFIDSLSFQVDGNSVEYFSREETPDIARIDLPQPLLPGGKLTLTTPFRVKIPKAFSRLGHNKQAYFISQWFPKPAVYDHKGWHPMSYLDIGEFYSEFGSYDVSITLPKNYIVMATGNLLNEDESQWLDSLSAVKPEQQSLVKAYKLRDVPFPPSSDTMKTLRFQEDYIHDFAWFADKRWLVRKDTVHLPGEDTAITVWTAFLPGTPSWESGTQYLKLAVRHYSSLIGSYPYKTIKAVEGDMQAGGGMEYPTITVIDRKMRGDKTAIIHEAGHNWFYGVLGSNEREHAWLDEGINSFYEQKVAELSDKPAKSAGAKRGMPDEYRLNRLMIGQLQASGTDQAIAQPSTQFRYLNYGMDVYYKTAMLLQWLEAYMGKAPFEAAMKAYYNTWKFRHPYPEDFRKIITQHTEKSVDWFFDHALYSSRNMDFSIKKVRKGDDGRLMIRVRNATASPLPVVVHVMAGDSVTATCVSEPFTGTTMLTTAEPVTSWTAVRIAPAVADTRYSNNAYQKEGLFRRTGITAGLFMGAETGYKEKVWLAPAIGYNVYDGFSAGLLFHNITWPENRFRFILAPMFGFESATPNGAGSVGYVWHPRQTFQEIMLQADVKSFHYGKTSTNIPTTKFARYLKIAPALHLTLPRASPLSPVTRTLTLKGFAISEDYFNYYLDPADNLYKPERKTGQQHYGQVRYRHEHDRTFNPFSYEVEGHGGNEFIKISAEGKIRIDYHAPKKSLYVRAYAGKFFLTGGHLLAASRYYLNSTFTGSNDYLYEDTYTGRSEQDGFGARQISTREGGMKIPTPFYASPLGRSDDWLVALNLKTDLPLRQLPVRLYLDVAGFADAGKLNPSGNKVLFNGGLELHFWDMLYVYVPLVMSQDYQEYVKSILGKDHFFKTITFSLQTSRINWLKMSSGLIRLMGY